MDFPDRTALRPYPRNPGFRMPDHRLGDSEGQAFRRVILSTTGPKSVDENRYAEANQLPWG
jgi:hypothetical protein